MKLRATARADLSAAAAALLALFTPEDEADEAERVVGAIILAEALDNLRLLREGLVRTR